MEINAEIYDPWHLSSDELDCVKRMAEDEVDDDPIARGLVNGYIMTTIMGQSLYESGYDDKFVESSELPKELQEAVSEERFNLAAKTAQELDPNLKIPKDLKQRVLAELSKISPERAKVICSVMGKPTLIIVPNNSFEDKIVQLDKNRHYDGQNYTTVERGSDEPYRNVRNPNKVRVCIVDGEPRPFVGRSEIRIRVWNSRAKRKSTGITDYIGPHRAAVLLQQGLLEAKETGDATKIIDSRTTTILNPENLSESECIAGATFSLHRYITSGIEFDSFCDNDNNYAYYVRVSMPVLEY